MVVNQKQLAEILGITARRVRDLKQLGFFECVKNGKGYDLSKCVQEYLEYKIKAEVGRGTSVDKEKEQAEHERIKKKITQLKLRRMRGELLETADVEAFLGDMLSNFRNKLMESPYKVAIKLVGQEDVGKIIKILEGQLNEVLDQLSDFDLADLSENDELFSEEEEEGEEEEE